MDHPRRVDLQQEVRRRGGLAATHELLAAGASANLLTAAVRRGVLVRIRQGHYGLPGADPILESAARVGGRATCITAARFLGLWVESSPKLHVRVDPHDSRLRRPDDARRRLAEHPADTRVHWRPSHGGTRQLLAPFEVLTDLIECLPAERVVAAADSAIRFGLVTRRQWRDHVTDLPPNLRDRLLRVDPRSESFLESIVRFRLIELGLAPRLQVQVGDVGRVDMIIGDRLIIELDGWEFHRSREAFEEDRRRDAELTRLGYRVLHFTYAAVMNGWGIVRSVILSCLQERSTNR